MFGQSPPTFPPSVVRAGELPLGSKGLFGGDLVGVEILCGGWCLSRGSVCGVAPAFFPANTAPKGAHLLKPRGHGSARLDVGTPIPPPTLPTLFGRIDLAVRPEKYAAVCAFSAI